jgi:hypothetical protein
MIGTQIKRPIRLGPQALRPDADAVRWIEQVQPGHIDPGFGVPTLGNTAAVGQPGDDVGRDVGVDAQAGGSDRRTGSLGPAASTGSV